MSRKRRSPKRSSKLRQLDVLLAQGHGVADAMRSVGVAEVRERRFPSTAGRAMSKPQADVVATEPNRNSAYEISLRGRVLWADPSGLDVETSGISLQDGLRLALGRASLAASALRVRIEPERGRRTWGGRFRSGP